MKDPASSLLHKTPQTTVLRLHLHL